MQPRQSPGRPAGCPIGVICNQSQGNIQCQNRLPDGHISIDPPTGSGLTLTFRQVTDDLMLTVTRLAKRCRISRATILYYERTGLLSPAHRSENGYRWYGDAEVERLEAILAYRAFGLSLASIGDLLDRKNGTSQSQLLRNHFHTLENEICQLRNQQRAIVALLQEPSLLEKNMVTKDRWVEIMKAAGFDEKSMVTWHQKFEEMEPEEHQKFLESLGIGAGEINDIRSL